ncbi:MAG: quinohemoprotein amine dehydrogenase subunit alpha [Blastocatellia bacterium]
MRVLKALALIILPFLCCLSTFSVQSQTQPPASEKPQEKPKATGEEGIPVTDKLTIEKCAGCHKRDEKGNLTRISHERLTPEGWQQAIKRMVRLNGLSLTPVEARAIVKYLSNQHGLAPEEAKPAIYQAEHRMIDEAIPDESTRTACTICHTYGRIISQRRTKEEWELLVNMHVGYFPVVEFQGFRRFPPPPDAPPPPPGTDTRHPADRAVEFLAKTFPLQTPEWSAWRATMRPPKIAGRWLVTGYQIGRGRVYGDVTIEPTAVEDEFTTKAKLTYVKENAAVARTGRSIVYAGYSWRGRSFGEKGSAANGNGEMTTATVPGELREVMMVSRDWSRIEGRWFWGDYEEFGIDVTLRRVDAAPIVAGLDRFSIKAPSTAERLTIFGANLPADLKPGDIDLGPGITVKRVVRATGDAVVVEVEVAETASVGKRDIAVRRSFAEGAITVFDKVDYIKVNPDNALARLGGVRYPKGYMQFEATGWNRGLDNKPQTADDLNLGPVDVEWTVEEFPSTFDDDDRNFIGSLSGTGFFTPALEGPNEKRKFGRNNYGEVWVVAKYAPPNMAKDAKPLTARSYFVVTIPLYVKWDQPEVAR